MSSGLLSAPLTPNLPSQLEQFYRHVQGARHVPCLHTFQLSKCTNRNEQVGRHVVTFPLLQPFNPLSEGGLEYACKHSSKGVMRGYAVGQYQKLVEELSFVIAELLHFHPIVCSANDGADGNRDDVQ